MTYIDDGKHVGEAHVGDDEEKCSVQILYGLLVVLLSEVHQTQDHTDYLGEEKSQWSHKGWSGQQTMKSEQARSFNVLWWSRCGGVCAQN